MREQARGQERMLDVEHREWMICLGRGFDLREGIGRPQLVARRKKEEGSAGAVRNAELAQRLHHRLHAAVVGGHGEARGMFFIRIAAIYAARIAFVEKVA